MIECLNVWLRFKADRRAVTALEYGLIAGLIAVAIIAGATSLGSAIGKSFNDIALKVNF